MITLGMIGCGYWGPNIVRNFNELDCKIKTISDLKEGRLKFINKRYPHIKTTKNYQEIIQDKDIDAIRIATPVTTNFRFAKEALEAGKHIYIEKPMTYTTDEAKALVELAEKKNKIILVGHIFQYSPAVTKIKELLDNDELGKIYYLDSVRINLGPPASEVDVIMDLAPHDFSIIYHLLGKEPLAISAVGYNYARPDLIDVAHINLWFDNNIMAKVHISWLSPRKTRVFQLMASKKVIYYDEMAQEKVKIFSEGIDNRINAKDTDTTELVYRPGDITIPALERKEPLKNECQHFLDCIRENKQPISNGKCGLTIVKMLEAASESAKNNGKIITF